MLLLSDRMFQVVMTPNRDQVLVMVQFRKGSRVTAHLHFMWWKRGAGMEHDWDWRRRAGTHAWSLATGVAGMASMER